MADLIDAKGIIHMINPAEGLGTISVTSETPTLLATFPLAPEHAGLAPGENVVCKVMKSPTGHTANGVRRTVG